MVDKNAVKQAEHRQQGRLLTAQAAAKRDQQMKVSVSAG